MEYTVYTPSFGQLVEQLDYHGYHLGLVSLVADLVVQPWN